MPRILTVTDRAADLPSFIARYWRKDVNGPFPLDLLSRPTVGPPIEARINAGRWIADCPTPRCSSASYVHLNDLRFFCVECLNPPDGNWRPVTVPGRRVELERLLLERPVPATRNWLPGESPADLARENAAEGIGKGR